MNRRERAHDGRTDSRNRKGACYGATKCSIASGSSITRNFSRDLDRAFSGLRTGLARFVAWDGSLADLGALLLSAAITALTFHGTAA